MLFDFIVSIPSRSYHLIKFGSHRHCDSGDIMVLVCHVIMPGVLVCTCNLATLENEFRNGVDSIPVGGNSPSMGGWIV